MCVAINEKQVKGTIIDFGNAYFEDEMEFEDGKECDKFSLHTLNGEMRALLEAPPVKCRKQDETNKNKHE